MAIEALPKDVSEEMKRIKEKNDSTVHGCHVTIEGDKAIIKIPNDKGFKLYEFPKREIKELFERLYVE